jgi:hypothetical protein
LEKARNFGARVTADGAPRFSLSAPFFSPIFFVSGERVAKPSRLDREEALR